MYEKYAELRDKKGLSDYAVAKAAGLGRSTLSDWKTGKHIPNRDNLKKIADYFNVSVDYFLGNEQAYYYDAETTKTAQELFDNPELRILFDAARDSKPEDLQMAADLLRRLKQTNPDG